MSITLANYGYVPYGKSLFGYVHMADPINACGPINFNIENAQEAAPIILVQRGDCPFVTKSTNA